MSLGMQVLIKQMRDLHKAIEGLTYALADARWAFYPAYQWCREAGKSFYTCIITNYKSRGLIWGHSNVTNRAR